MSVVDKIKAVLGGSSINVGDDKFIFTGVVGIVTVIGLCYLGKYYFHGKTNGKGQRKNKTKKINIKGTDIGKDAFVANDDVEINNPNTDQASLKRAQLNPACDKVVTIQGGKIDGFVGNNHVQKWDK